MASKAPRYNVLNFLGQKVPGYATENAHAVVAIVRLGTPVSYDRDLKKSVSTDPNDGVGPRGPNGGLLLLSDDITSLSVQRGKHSHLKQATLTTKGPRTRLVAEIIPGDWALVWLVPSKSDHDRLIQQIKDGKPCNKPEDGLKLVGRVHQVRKRLTTSSSGVKDVTYAVQMVGFSEFDSLLYYEFAAASADVFDQNIGGYMARLGLDADHWFHGATGKARKNNINQIMPDIVEMVLGKGVTKNLNTGAASGVGIQNIQALGAGAGEDAPNAYVVPAYVGNLLGRDNGKSILAYADLIERSIGGEVYEAAEDKISKMRPTSTYPLEGTFLPAFPQMVNTPFWEVFEHYLNPAINEIYTCLRPTSEGVVAPTLVIRQIPFTTDAFSPDGEGVDHVTTFLSLPRWVVPLSLVINSDIGRSDATRTNFVHVYGSAMQFTADMTTTDQIVSDRPVRDDLDVQRSGPRPYMTTVECAIDEQWDGEAGKWMAVIADYKMGSHLTLNGTTECIGLPGPIAEGDNVEIDGVVFHIEEISDLYHRESQGTPRWRTILRLDNGVLSEGSDPLHYYGIDDKDVAHTGAGGDPGSIEIGITGTVAKKLF